MVKSDSISEYQAMWLFVLFDLPVKTKAERRRYGQFRKLLLEEGFSQLQYSVYARYFGDEEKSASLRKRIRDQLPPNGHVRVLLVTDRQFGKMESFLGKIPARLEKPPDQMLLF